MDSFGVSVTLINAIVDALFHTQSRFGALMKSLFVILLLTFGIVFNAAADVWKWVDAQGEEHYVDTNRPIFTWVDEFGKIHYSDKPDHEDAVSVRLVWVSSRALDDVAGDEEGGAGDGNVYASETAEHRAEREAAEKYYCKRATQIYESYANAPQLYRTNDAGQRIFLDKNEVAAMIAETKVKMDHICK